ETKLRKNARLVLEASREKGLTPRAVAMEIARERVNKAMKRRMRRWKSRT
ncbi:MAG: hypothetical protein GY800_00240, partial [Planctomycetes bacterium]|nr:hypothetical protein [Planctomycetota bacterium]